MLRHVAACCVAALLIVAWPARSGVDPGTLADFHAAALAPARDTVATKARDRVEVRTENNANRDAPEEIAALEPTPPAIAPPVAEPFGLSAAPVAGGDVVTKWRGVEAAVSGDNEILARCRLDMQRCPPAARRFLAIVAQGRARTGRARIGVINRAVNMAIAPMSDLKQWGVPDRWSAPLETFTTGHGDCEDYAIAKYVALTAAGVAAADVRLVIVRNTAAHEDHAVVAVKSDGGWIVLDNRWLTLVTDVDLPKAVPLFVLDDSGVRQFAAPAIASRQTPAPASF